MNKYEAIGRAICGQNVLWVEGSVAMVRAKMQEFRDLPAYKIFDPQNLSLILQVYPMNQRAVQEGTIYFHAHDRDESYQKLRGRLLHACNIEGDPRYSVLLKPWKAPS